MRTTQTLEIKTSAERNISDREDIMSYENTNFPNDSSGTVKNAHEKEMQLKVRENVASIENRGKLN